MDEMFRGKCINASGVNNLKEGELYYLFKAGQVAYYVSNYPRQLSHFGAYDQKRFELINYEVVSNENTKSKSSPNNQELFEQTNIFDFLNES